MNMKQLANNLHNIILGPENEFGMKKNSELIMLIMFSLNKEI